MEGGRALNRSTISWLTFVTPCPLVPPSWGPGHRAVATFAAEHRAPWAPVSVLSTRRTPRSTPALAPGGCSLPALACVQALRGALLAKARTAESEPLLTWPPRSVPSHVPGGWGGFSRCRPWRGAEVPGIDRDAEGALVTTQLTFRLWPSPQHGCTQAEPGTG